MIFLKLFIIFTKIGTFNFGGGYAMLSLIHNEVVVKNAWLSNAEFTDIVAISQSTPASIIISIGDTLYAGLLLKGLLMSKHASTGIHTLFHPILAVFAILNTGAAIRATTEGLTPMKKRSTHGLSL